MKKFFFFISIITISCGIFYLTGCEPEEGTCDSQGSVNNSWVGSEFDVTWIVGREPHTLIISLQNESFWDVEVCGNGDIVFYVKVDAVDGHFNDNVQVRLYYRADLGFAEPLLFENILLDEDGDADVTINIGSVAEWFGLESTGYISAWIEIATNRTFHENTDVNDWRNWLTSEFNAFTLRMEYVKP